MRVRLVRRPGQHGTRLFVEQYGDRLICVRYRYDEAARRRYKTVEVIVDDAPWEPKKQHQEKPAYRGTDLVGVRTRYGEDELRLRLRGIGAGWIPQLRMWVLTYEQALALGLGDRIAGTIAALAAKR